VEGLNEEEGKKGSRRQREGGNYKGSRIRTKKIEGGIGGCEGEKRKDDLSKE